MAIKPVTSAVTQWINYSTFKYIMQRFGAIIQDNLIELALGAESARPSNDTRASQADVSCL